MNYNKSEEIVALKEKLVDLFYWMYAVFMWFALSGSIYRAVDTGVKTNHYFQGSLVIVFLVLFLLRKKLSYSIKSYSLIIITFLLAASGLISFGLLSQGLYFLFLFVTLTLFLFGNPHGLISFIFSILFFATIGILHHKLILTFDPINPNYSNSTSAWLMAILIFTLITLMIYMFWQQIYSFLLAKVDQIVANDAQLSKINKLLSREIETRKSTEKKLSEQFEESQAINDEYQEVNKELITANKNLELSNSKLHIANEKSKAAEQLKSAFLDNMSHEIRTPLNAIVGFTTLLTNDDLNSNDRHNYLNIIQASTSNLLGIISDIVNIAKIQSNQYSINLIEFKINDLLDEISERYTREIFVNKEDNVEFIIDNKLKHCTIIKSDLECIKIIINKLLDNAIKFTSCGSIKLVCNVIQNHILCIEVIDTGIGIADDKKQIIFNTFQQAENSETRKYGGTGLGLSIIKGLTDLLSGSISFTSKIKEGSTFAVNIPIFFVASNDKNCL